MTRVFFLGPGYYEGQSKGDEPLALRERYRFAELLEPREVLIMELVEPDQEDLVQKFKDCMPQCDEVLVWLPAKGHLTTVFGELLLLRYEDEWKGKPVVILSEEGVLDASGPEFWVLKQEGQIGYLRDLPKHYDVSIFEYDTREELDDLVKRYGRGLLSI